MEKYTSIKSNLVHHIAKPTKLKDMRVLCIKSDSEIIEEDGSITKCSSPLVIEGLTYTVIDIYEEDGEDWYELEEIAGIGFSSRLFIPTSDRDEVEIMAERSLEKLLAIS